MGGRPSGHPQRPRGAGARADVRPAGAGRGPHVWEHDGEEHIETVALGLTGPHANIRLPDPRYRFTAVWLDATDVKRINPS
jgi:hypothetical protein